VGHSCGQALSFPVGSVHPACQMVPMYSFLVAMQRPLSRQMSVEAQQPLCLAPEAAAHGVKVLLSFVPSRL
jgi:hypothetical protein